MKQNSSKKTKSIGKAARKKSATKTASAETNEAVENLKHLTHRPKHTPSVFKLPVKKTAPIVFTLDDVREVLKNRKPEKPKKVAKPKAKKAVAKKEIIEEKPASPKKLNAASLSDILGFNPAEKKPLKVRDRDNVPKEFLRYYDILIELREHVSHEIDIHTKDTLKHKSGDESSDSGNVSSHMADNGTDAFDRDFALSLVSSESEALTEINEAIDRIFDGNYGTCEQTGKKISPDRLEAVPFTRYSIEGQAEFEKTSYRKKQTGGVFMDVDPADTASFIPDDIDE